MSSFFSQLSQTPVLSIIKQSETIEASICRTDISWVPRKELHIVTANNTGPDLMGASGAVGPAVYKEEIIYGFY